MFAMQRGVECVLLASKEMRRVGINLAETIVSLGLPRGEALNLKQEVFGGFVRLAIDLHNDSVQGFCSRQSLIV